MIKEPFEYFSRKDIGIVNNSVAMAEELVSNHFKLSATQLMNLNYDIKTLAHLTKDEIVCDHFAQVIRYALTKKKDFPGTPAKDFYKICLQDHSIIKTMRRNRDLDLFAFALYIVAHELIHVIRFQRFLQHFDALCHEKNDEEVRVHQKTHEILSKARLASLNPVFEFYEKWRTAPGEMENP
ncbi:MAG: hypothetical protein WA081_23955 [Desulfosalsimonadaceae bacterium]